MRGVWVSDGMSFAGTPREAKRARCRCHSACAFARSTGCGRTTRVNQRNAHIMSTTVPKASASLNDGGIDTSDITRPQVKSFLVVPYLGKRQQLGNTRVELVLVVSR